MTEFLVTAEEWAAMRPTALINQTKDAMRKNTDSVMWELAGNDIDKVTGRTAFDGLRKGDRAAIKVVNQYINYIAVGIVNIINIFQPEKICIGGGISNEKEGLIKPLNDIVTKFSYTRHTDAEEKVCVAKLGNDAGIIGAAFLGI